jgi:hypothetical protein
VLLFLAPLRCLPSSSCGIFTTNTWHRKRRNAGAHSYLEPVLIFSSNARFERTQAATPHRTKGTQSRVALGSQRYWQLYCTVQRTERMNPPAARRRSRLPCVLLPALVNWTILLRISKQQTNLPPHCDSTRVCSATKRQNAQFVLSDRDTAPTRCSQATGTNVQSLATRGRQISCVKFGLEHAVPTLPQERVESFASLNPLEKG